MEGFVTIFIFLGVIVVTALLFGGWLIFTIVRLLFRAIGALLDAPSPRAHSLPPPQSARASVRCPNSACRNSNPSAAMFCRRCGAALPPAQRVAVRRAAMW